MGRLPRRKGSDLGHLTETGTETGTGSPPLLKTESGIGPGIGVEGPAGLAPVPGPSLRKETDGTENGIRSGIGIRRTEIGIRMDTDGTRTGSDPVYLLDEEKILNLGETET